MTAIALVVALALLAALAIMQILAASGLPLGHFGWGGQHRVLPRGRSPGRRQYSGVRLDLGGVRVLRRERGAQRDLAQPRRTLDDDTDQPPAGSSNARHRPGRKVTVCS